MSVHTMAKRLIVVFCVFILGIGLWQPQTASAHAVLKQATPVQGSQLDESPDRITLTFNETLSEHLYRLKVFNQDMQLVTQQKPQLTKQKHRIVLDIPELSEGVYTVSYKVISADGHPVSGLYTFSVGKVAEQASALNAANNILLTGHSHSIFVFIVRIAYLLSLLFLTGWVLWTAIRPRSELQHDDRYRQVTKSLKIIYLLMLLGYGFVVLTNLISNLGDHSFISLFTQSMVGSSWLVSLFLIVIGFWLLGRSRIIDLCWVFIILLAEAINGHAFAFAPHVLTLLFDFLHLAAAALWVGGLVYIISLRKKQPALIRDFIPTFSKIALASIVVLIVTGALNTILYLPRISDIFLTAWGRFLLGKIALVIIVIITAALIRRALHRHDEEKRKARITIDFTTMILIIAIAAIFTALNPRPVNEPFNWGYVNKQISVQTNITPKLPHEDNTITVSVRDEQRPDKVIMVLKDEQGKLSAPVTIPLKPNGKIKGNYIYQTHQGFIPFAGEWSVVIKVIDHHGHLYKMTEDMRVFPTDF